MHPASLSLSRRPLVHGEPQVPGPCHALWLQTSGQVFWLPDQPTACAFPSHFNGTVASCRVRPRSQRRDRDGSAVFPIKPRKVPGQLTISGWPVTVNFIPNRRGSVTAPPADGAPLGRRRGQPLAADELAEHGHGFVHFFQDRFGGGILVDFAVALQ